MISLIALMLLSPETTPAWAEMSKAERVQALNTIADQCHLSRKIFRLSGEDDLHVRPNPHDKFESVDCALLKLKEVRGFANMGFVGNEQYEPEKK